MKIEENINRVPEVSVIVPTYNYARFLGEAIRSVLDQTFADFELIVVDDGSTDDTRKVVASFPDRRIRYIYQENRGVAAAQNTGIKAATGKYIAILGADDIWLPQNLELKVKALESRPDTALVCSDAYLFDDRTGDTLGRYWHDKPFHYWVDPERAAQQPLLELLSRGCFITPQTLLVRREVIDEVGYFDESLTTHEDWDLLVRITRQFAVDALDIPLAKIRRHDISLTADWEKMYHRAVLVLGKAMRQYSFSPAEKKLIRRRLARTHFSYGKSLVANGNALLGRKTIIAAIKTYPWSIKPYFYLAGSLLGNIIIQSVKSWRQRHSRRVHNKAASVKIERIAGKMEV